MASEADFFSPHIYVHMCIHTLTHVYTYTNTNKGPGKTFLKAADTDSR